MSEPEAEHASSSRALPRWPLGLALLIALGEVFGGLRLWVNGPGTIAALLLFPFWATTLLRDLTRPRSGDAVDRGPAVGSWLRVAAVVLLAIHLGCQIVKLSLLRYVAAGHDPTPLIAGYRSFVLVALGARLAAWGIGPRLQRALLVAVAEHTARLVALSFSLTILLGAFLLMLPMSVRNPADISFVDSLFTSASAVCVTGLVVNVVPKTYTPFGQVVILGLIQVGGLGIMVLYGAMVALAGRRMSVKHARLVSEVVDVETIAGMRRLLWGILSFTLVVEAIGATILYYSLLPYSDVATGPEFDSARAGSGSILWASVFHSVSAYCNAGFSVFRDGIVPFAGNWAISGTIMTLVFIGGLGFPVWFEVLRRMSAVLRRRRPERMSIHTRSALAVSLALVVLGAVVYLVLEWRHSMQGLPLHAKVLTAAFQSVITRTAGFNSLDYAQMAPATWFVTCVLMFIGASPGSTGGGIKTTTFAVLIATMTADLFGRPRVELGDRSLSDVAVRRAVAVTLISVAVVTLITFLLLLLEPFDALRLWFETVSALATVGLSTGITPQLSVPGKLVVALAMYIGRIGPLTLALALARRGHGRPARFPEERVGIG